MRNSDATEPEENGILNDGLRRIHDSDCGGYDDDDDHESKRFPGRPQKSVVGAVGGAALVAEIRIQELYVPAGICCCGQHQRAD